MTILRPCVDSLSALANRKQRVDSNLSRMKQEAADHFWEWAESRIRHHTGKFCEESVKSVVDRVTDRGSRDSRLKLILTQSASTLDSESPFDRLSEHFSIAGVVPVRISGSSTLTIESVQVSLLMGALGVSTSVVFLNTGRSGVSLKGLDLSVLEDVPVDKDLAVIIEEGDSLDKELLFKIIELVHHLHAKLKTRGCSASLILETDLGESMIEEIVHDESVFSSLELSKCALIDARELNGKIKSIFFGPCSEKNVRGFPIHFSQEDFDFLAKDLPPMSLSPMDVCEHIVVMVRRWFQRCQFSFLVGSVAVNTGNEETIARRIEEDLMSVFSELRIDDPILMKSSSTSIKLTRKAVTTFQQLLMNNLDLEQRLATIGLTLRNVARALEVACDEAIDQFILSCTDRFFSRTDKDPSISRIFMEIRCKKINPSPATTPDTVISNTVRLNEELVQDLIELGMSRDSGAVDSIDFLNEQLRPLANQHFHQSKVLEEFYSILHKFVEKSLKILIGNDDCKDHEIVQSLFQPKSNHQDCLTNVGTFDNFISFFRSLDSKSGRPPIVEKGLAEVSHVTRLIYGDGKAQKGKAKTKNGKHSITHNQIDLDLITQTFPTTEVDLAEALATLEYLGLIRPPGVVDLVLPSTSLKVRKIYKDTSLISCERTSQELGDSHDDDE